MISNVAGAGGLCVTSILPHINGTEILTIKTISVFQLFNICTKFVGWYDLWAFTSCNQHSRDSRHHLLRCILQISKRIWLDFALDSSVELKNVNGKMNLPLVE